MDPETPTRSISTVRNWIFKSLSSELARFNEHGRDASEFEAALKRISNEIAREIHFGPAYFHGNYVHRVERRLDDIEELLKRGNP